MNRETWKYLHREHRAASRNLLAPGALERSWNCTHALRELTGRFINFPDPYRGCIYGRAVRTATGRYVYRLAGPYLSGRRGALSR